MTDWRDRLLPASFRGVPFLYADTRREGGRRLANNEFPLRDDNYVEDLGLKAKSHHIAGYVLGNDYDSARDALEAALDTAGSGTLVHPYKGNLSVNVEDYSIQESIEEGGLARFEMIFIDAGKQPSPTSSANTATTASDAAISQSDVLGGQFDALYSLQGLSGIIRDALSGNIGGLLRDVTDLLGQFGLSSPGLLADISNIQDAIGLGVDISLSVSAFFQDYCAAAVEILPVDDPTLTSRGQPPVADPSYGLAGFTTWGGDLPFIIGSTPQRIQEASNQTAFIALVQGCAVAAMAQLYANTDFASANDAQAARDQMDDLIDIQATAAADLGDDTIFTGWMTLFSAVYTDLTARALRLPEILTFEFASSMPAIVLAQRIYQDGSRAPDLISRNAAPHPLFMPRHISALAA